MSFEIGVSIAGIILGVLGLTLSWVCRRTFRQHRELLDFLASQTDELQENLAQSKEKLAALAKSVSDQSRRIAWLETRVRQPKVLKEAAVAETPLTGTLKSNMNERRARVLTLAARGQDAKKIASALGMMPGEVELIINLNRVSATI
jgi:hypothetical protein